MTVFGKNVPLAIMSLSNFNLFSLPTTCCLKSKWFILFNDIILLLNYLNYKNIILINVTSDLEDVLYTDYVLCLFDGKSAIDGKTIDVLKNEKILKRLGFSLPFMVDLSIQLQAYNLISKMYLNKEAMVRNLWK